MLPTMRSTTSDAGLRRLSDLRHEMDRLFEDAFEGRGREGGSRSRWAPPANLVETDDAYEVTLEIPGFDRDDLEVAIDQGVLAVTGRRTADHEQEGRTYHLRERATGQFRRAFSLPNSVSAEEVAATYEEGVLRVHLPKQPEAKTRKIEVEVG